MAAPMIKKSFFALALLLVTATPAFALSCMADTSELPKLKVLYKAYVESGRPPVAKLLNHQAIGTVGISINGVVTGLTEFESCWKDNPPCHTDAQYDSANINFITSANELTKVYQGNASIALLECFRKLGLGQQEKKSFVNGLEGIFR